MFSSLRAQNHFPPAGTKIRIFLPRRLDLLSHFLILYYHYVNMEQEDDIHLSQLSMFEHSMDAPEQEPPPITIQSESWEAFLSSLKPKSRQTYEKRVQDLLHYVLQNRVEATTDLALIIRYFREKHDEILPTGERRYSGTVFRSWLSICTKLWLHLGNGSLQQQCPILETLCSQWEKEHEVQKAKTFTKEQLGILSLS